MGEKVKVDKMMPEIGLYSIFRKETILRDQIEDVEFKKLKQKVFDNVKEMIIKHQTDRKKKE